MRRSLWAVLALMLAAGLLSGCGKDKTETVSADQPTLDEQVGFDGDPGLARQAKAENLIRECMTKQGFEYVPADPTARQSALTGGRALTEEEFHAQYGYGITTLYEERLRQVGAGPNEAIRNALSTEEKAAYDHALAGEDPTATFAVALDSGDFSKLGGCLKQATDKAFGGAELVGDLQSKMDELDQRILEDARMLTAVKKWSACMGKAGYDLVEPDEVDSYLDNKLEAIVGPPETATTTPPGGTAAYDAAALKTLQREEVDMVKLDIDCDKKYIADVEDKVTDELTKAFREKNAGLLQKVPKP